MIAAIYARKSTEQHVADDQRSVARQIAHAKEYALRKGWTVDDAHVYVDDGISGAEFANRPGFVRLMSSLNRGRRSRCSSCPKSHVSDVKRSKRPTR